MTTATSSEIATRTPTREEWRQASLCFDDFGYRLLWEYSDALASMHGARSERRLITRAGEVIGMAEARVRALPLGAGGIAYLSGGPAVRRKGATDEESIVAFRGVIEALRNELVGERKLTLRVLCPVAGSAWNTALADELAARGFAPVEGAQGYRTIMIDTGRPLDDINASFNKTWRKYLRRAERDGVTIRRATDDDAFAHVIRLHDTLRERKGFGVTLDGRFYANLQRSLPERDKMVVILAELSGEIVGMNLVSAQGDTLAGIIGATTPAGAEANAAYSLEWDAVSLAVELGMSRYDLGGIDPEGNPGVYTFKKGTHGEDVKSAGPLELDPGPLRRAVRSASERAVKALKRRTLRA